MDKDEQLQKDIDIIKTEINVIRNTIATLSLEFNKHIQEHLNFHLESQDNSNLSCVNDLGNLAVSITDIQQSSLIDYSFIFQILTPTIFITY